MELVSEKSDDPFADYEVASQSLKDRVGSLFHRAESIVSGTAPNDGRNLATPSKYKMILLCRGFTHSKLYMAKTSSREMDATYTAQWKLLSQSRVLGLFYSTILENISQFAGNCTKDLCTAILGSFSSEEVLVRWERVYTRYHKVLNMLLPVINYVPTNYSYICKDDLNGFSILEYADSLLLASIKHHSEEAFISFLQITIQYSITHEQLQDIRAVPLIVANKFQIPLSTQESLSFTEFYLTLAQQHIAETINDDKLSFVKIYKSISKLTTVAAQISPSMVEVTLETVIRNTVLKPELLAQLIKTFEVPSDYKVYLQQLINLPCQNELAALWQAYASRQKEALFNKVFCDRIEQLLQSACIHHKDLERIFATACWSTILAKNVPHLKALVKNRLASLLGGEIRILEAYQNMCDSKIKQIDNIQNVEADISLPLEKWYLLKAVPTLLSLSPGFLRLHARSLFRRFILDGPKYAATFLKPCFLQYHLLKEFRSSYDSSPEFEMLSKVVLDIITATKYASRSASITETSGGGVTLVPLVFERNSHPSYPEHDNNDNLHLPDELMTSWGKFLQVVSTIDKKASMKKYELAYSLQHCVVETPYKLQNKDEYLNFELTLYQTCVLSLFNDYDQLTFAQLKELTNMEEQQLKLVLLSFSNISLIVKKKSAYQINQHFVPMKHRIKNGSMRIPLPRSIDRPVSNRAQSLQIKTGRHQEGSRSRWRLELLKACLVRSIKSAPEGLQLSELEHIAETQIHGSSIGELKDALKKCLKDGLLTEKENRFYY